MIKLGLNDSKRTHKVRGNQYLTLMFISDATKDPKSIRIPKWLRFPMLVLVVFIIWKSLTVYEHVVTLEAKVANYSLAAQEAHIESQSKDSILVELQDELNTTKESRYQQLLSLKELAIKLGLRLEELESYRTEMEQFKLEIDSNIGASGESTKESKAVTIETSTLSSTLLAETRKLSINPSPIVPGFSTSAPYQVPYSFLTELVQEEVPLHIAFNQGGGWPEGYNESEVINFDSIDFDTEIFQIYNYLDLVSEKASESYDTFEKTSGSLEEIIPVLESYPGVLPIKSTRITSYFGYRNNPFGRRRTEFHSGIDLKAQYVDVSATAAGIVIESKYLAGYGYTVIIDHGDGIMTKYAHNSKLYVKAGDEVKRGDVISRSGNTGRSTGPHLHYEILKNGVPQNPLDYIYKENN
jgi:murein DD-endopeptidase MepM/ murein hydrolase activator NlpD